MFMGCTNLETIKVIDWDVSKVIDTTSMFSGCEKLKTILAAEDTDWATEAKITSSSSMFYNCPLLPNFDSSEIDVSKANASSTGYFTADAPVWVAHEVYVKDEGV